LLLRAPRAAAAGRGEHLVRAHPPRLRCPL
jgi:hypothetical protein